MPSPPPHHHHHHQMKSSTLSDCHVFDTPIQEGHYFHRIIQQSWTLRKFLEDFLSSQQAGKEVNQPREEERYQRTQNISCPGKWDGIRTLLQQPSGQKFHFALQCHVLCSKFCGSVPIDCSKYTIFLVEQMFSFCLITSATNVCTHARTHAHA